MEVKGVSWHLGPDKPQIELVPSDSNGLFVVRERDRSLVGARALLSGVAVVDAKSIERGDRTPLDHYMVADDSNPGFYNLEEGSKVTMRTAESTFSSRGGLFGEFVPYPVSNDSISTGNNR